MIPTVESKFADIVVDGKRLETLWLKAGDASTPTIVMLHEGLGSVALWRDFPSALATRTGCGVLVYSRYGHGNSDKQSDKRPISFMQHEAEAVLPELLDKLGVSQPILLGHSDGGSIALIFAGRYPERVRALILEAPHVFVEDLSVASITETKSKFQNSDLRARLGCYHAHVDAMFWAWNDVWLDSDFRSWNIEAFLDTIRCPVLCIQGEDDEYGTRAQLQAIVARVPNTEIVMLPSCGHSPHRDQRAATLETVARFVERIRREPRMNTDFTDQASKAAEN
jgi:pimeloyl-ACP methyl ester carboxylesterase